MDGVGSPHALSRHGDLHTEVTADMPSSFHNSKSIGSKLNFPPVKLPTCQKTEVNKVNKILSIISAYDIVYHWTTLMNYYYDP